mmetsp:Transcript_27932/g.63951  ORF Transcript_27932/g.63951 Transcript_27932/m.63951 type:complete len:206 (-) Transcript_27932:39-656(-)
MRVLNHASRSRLLVSEGNCFKTRPPPPFRPNRPCSSAGRPSENHLAIAGTIPHGGNGIEVGQYAEAVRIFQQRDVRAFGMLVGDLNPIHFELNAGRGSGHKRPIVHGILASSLFSSIFGTLIPGSMYRAQELAFRSPIFVDEAVTAHIVVTRTRLIKRLDGVLIDCDTTISQKDTIVDAEKKSILISGTAQIWLSGLGNKQFKHN